jgi:hypothetical protein
VDIPADVKDALKKFRFKKSTSNSAISGMFPHLRLRLSWWVVKIVKAKLVMQIDESLDDMSIEEIAEGMRPTVLHGGDWQVELPENAPRYVVLSYEMVSHTLSWGGVWEADDRNTPMDESQTRSYWLIGISTPQSWPQTLIIRAPSSSPTDLMTLHASMLSNFQQVVEVSKVRKLIQWVKEGLINRY